MEGHESESFPFILQFRDHFQTHRINAHLMLDSQHLYLIPVLAGTSPHWNKGKTLKRYLVDMCPVQEIESYSLQIGDVKMSLRIMKNCILYGNHETELHQANYDVCQEYYETYIINWMNVYRVLHYLMPSKAQCFKHVLILDIKASCRVNCFQSKTKITHDKLLNWLRRFIFDHFHPTLSENALSKPVQNRIGAWSILSVEYTNLLKTEIFNMNHLTMSDRCHSLIKEVMKVTNRNDALDLYESFKKGNDPSTRLTRCTTVP